MQLVRKLHGLAAQGNFTVRMAHVAGQNNQIADALSRHLFHQFRLLAPHAQLQLTSLLEHWDKI